MNVNTVRTLARRWNEAGLDPKVSALSLEADERAQSLALELRDSGDDAGQQRSAVIGALARGEVTVGEAVATVTALTTGRASKELATELVRAAQRRVAANAFEEFRKFGESLIVDHLAPANDQTIARLVALAAKLPKDVTTDAAAVKAGSKVLQTWGEMVECATRRHRLVDLAERLRTDKLVASVKGPVHPDEYAWRHPEKVTAATGPAHLRLLASIEAGAGPAILTAAEVTAIREKEGRVTRRFVGKQGPRVRTDGSIDWEPQPAA